MFPNDFLLVQCNTPAIFLHMHGEDPRAALRRLAREHGCGLSALSTMIGRNRAYLQQYITRGTPARLEEDDRRCLAEFLGVEAQVLGPIVGEHRSSENRFDDLIHVSRLAVRASAGPGAIVDEEVAVGRMGFDPAWLKSLTRAGAQELSIIRVAGDSMAPTLVDGDDVLIDGSAAGQRLRDGIYVLRRDDTLMVKRLAVAPTSSTLTVSSDNPAYPSWRDCSVDSIIVVGRAIWSGRRLDGARVVQNGMTPSL